MTNYLELTDLKNKLAKNALFDCLSEQQLDNVRMHCSVVSLRGGEVLFNQGDKAEYFYLVDTGLIKLYRHSVDGQEKIFELEKPGQVFAEALMFRGMNSYPVSAAAMSRSQVLAISNSKFLNILQESGETSLSMIGDLSLRLHQMVVEIDRLSLLNGRMRVATYLLDQYLLKGRIFTLEVPKSALASMLALQPESFSRLLKELLQAEAIDVRGNEIEILNDRVLRQSAGIINSGAE